MSKGRPLPIGGYVLAGGQSSRMGREKALLELGGRPLIEHAVRKLRRFCADVGILTANRDLGRFGPIVPDLHPGCGPMGGMEAALTHSGHDWNLVAPVDVPFLPALLLESWAEGTLADAENRIAMFEVDGIAQPALLMIHRDVLPWIATALERGEYKLGPLLHRAAEDLAATRGIPASAVLRKCVWGRDGEPPWGGGVDESESRWSSLTCAQLANRELWFANLNTPEELAEAEKHLDSLDT